MRCLSVFFGFMLLLGHSAAEAQTEKAQPPSVGPLRLMGADRFSSMGLSNLSQPQVDQLNMWIQAYSQYYATSVSTPSSSGAIETRIDGDFNGWEGETVYKMENGQIWQQSSYHYHYHYAYRPKVFIFQSGGGYKIKVEGDGDESVSVRRLK